MAVSKRNWRRAEPTQEQLVDERVGFERVIAPLATKDTCSHVPQLWLNYLKKPFGCLDVAMPPFVQPSGDLVRRGNGGHEAMIPAKGGCRYIT
jgi:hypothetical protein